MKTGPDEVTCIFGAGVMCRYLQAMSQEIEGVRLGVDIETIHRMRVASRRLRAAMPLFSTCLPSKKLDGWQKQVRKITRALGIARDADVQIELMEEFYSSLPQANYRPGIRRLLLRLQQKRQGQQARVDKALDRLENSQALVEIKETLTPLVEKQVQIVAYSPDLYRLAFDSIKASLDELLAYEAVVYEPEQVEQLHAMRIAAKRLRYTLETFAGIYVDELKQPIQVMRKIQDALGEIHDCDVWTSYLPEVIEDERRRALDYYGSTRPVGRLIPGLLFFQQNRRAAREKEYQEFVEDWKKWQAKGIWESLDKTIRQPLIITGEVYPPSPPPPVVVPANPAPESEGTSP